MTPLEEAFAQIALENSKKDTIYLPEMFPTYFTIPKETLEKTNSILKECEESINKANGQKANLPTDDSLALAISTYPRLFKFQSKYERELWHKIVELGHPASMLIAATGLGKTYIVGELLAQLFRANWFDKFQLSLVKVLYVTKASVVTQSERVLKEFGLNVSSAKALGADVYVTNYDQLRSSLGELMIEDYTEIVKGEPVIKFRWKENVTPILVIWDECHSLMNESSIQSKIAQALNDLEEPRRSNVVQIFTSATPFGRVCEAKCFAVATRMTYKYGFISSPLTNAHWLDFASDVAYPHHYQDHSPGACKSLVERLDEYIVTVKGARPKFHARNNVCLIGFQTHQEAQLYQKAFEEYQEKLLESQGRELEGLAKIWVAMLKFRQAAELIRAPYLAKAMFEGVVKHNKASVSAVCFRATIARIVEILVNDYDVSRDIISLIWGGVEDVKNLREEYQDLDLGPQNRKQRQEEIDKFQEGKSLYCLFTFKAGGAGLSLHHSKEGLRPREVFLTPIYNAKELVQGLGRCPRLTSRSDTTQTIIFYRGTEEEKVASKVSVKLRCLTEVIRQKESWDDVFMKESLKKLREVPIEDENEIEDNNMYLEEDNNEKDTEVIDI